MLLYLCHFLKLFFCAALFVCLSSFSCFSNEKYLFLKEPLPGVRYPYLEMAADPAAKGGVVRYLNAVGEGQELTLLNITPDKEKWETRLYTSDEGITLHIPWQFLISEENQPSIKWLSFQGKCRREPLSFEKPSQEKTVCCYHPFLNNSQERFLFPWNFQFFRQKQPGYLSWRGWKFEHLTQTLHLSEDTGKLFAVPKEQPSAPHWSATCPADYPCQLPSGLLAKLRTIRKNSELQLAPQQRYELYQELAEEFWEKAEGSTFQNVSLS